MANLRRRIEEDECFLDSAVMSHGFTDYLRDYDVVIDVPAALPPGVPIGETTGSYIEARYRYRFTHCPEAHIVSAVGHDVWRRSWDEVFTDYEEWESAGNPEGSFGESSGPTAAAWTDRLGREMHEVAIETNAFTLRLVCHDLRIEQLAVGDPWTHELTPLAPE